jgi:hypothetical protein
MAVGSSRAGGVPGENNDRSHEMFHHPFVSEWHQQWHEREVEAMVRQRQFVVARRPERRIRRAIGRSMVRGGAVVGRSMVNIGRRLAAEPARSVARPR